MPRYKPPIPRLRHQCLHNISTPRLKAKEDPSKECNHLSLCRPCFSAKVAKERFCYLVTCMLAQLSTPNLIVHFAHTLRVEMICLDLLHKDAGISELRKASITRLSHSAGGLCSSLSGILAELALSTERSPSMLLLVGAENNLYLPIQPFLRK